MPALELSCLQRRAHEKMPRLEKGIALILDFVSTLPDSTLSQRKRRKVDLQLECLFGLIVMSLGVAHSDPKTEDATGEALLIIKKDGVTRYCEFGRYDSENKGQTRRITAPNVSRKNGHVTKESPQKVFRTLSAQSGKGGTIRAGRFIEMNFDALNSFAGAACAASTSCKLRYDANRRVYEIAKYNCGHFAEKEILKAHSNLDRPEVINPAPNNLVDEYINEGNAEVIYMPKTEILTIGLGDESDAKE